jgi:hypothetical protein
MAPPAPNGLQYPVWRIALGEAPNDSAVLRFFDQQETASFEPANMSLLPYGAPPVPIRRIIWFAAHSPVGNPEEPIIYNNRAVPPGMPAALGPGRYAVVGPRSLTHCGSSESGEPSQQSIHLSAGGISVTGLDGQTVTPPVGSSIQPVLGIIAATDPPRDWERPAETAPQGIGISVSEPLSQGNYYDEPSVALGPNLPVDAYDDPKDPKNVFPDKPLDGEGSRPLSRNELRRTGTRMGYRAAFLQRLANPLQPFDAILNPYVTIDWSTIDLTVFNGEDRAPEDFPEGQLGPFDPDDDKPFSSAPSERFASRQRGRLASDGSHWSPWTNDPATTPAEVTTGGSYFPYRLRNTLGYLNSIFVAGRLTARRAPPPYLGDPPRPFPWLTWHNRPFVSHLELMLVPSSSPARLMYEFSPQASGSDPYRNSGGSPTDFRARGAFQGPFRHLINFFHSSASTSSPDVAAHFSRLLDYVEVPSPFVGTEAWHGPASTVTQSAVPFLRPPYNGRPTFREPGRVNINTVYDPLIWRAIAAGFPPMDSADFWEKVARSREGYRGGPASDYPTSFANPFRSAHSADLMPLPQLRQVSAEATLLRSDPDDDQRPLFVVDTATHPETTQPHRDQKRNAYFYYQGLQRLGNLLTTHSNVYAVWITVGYFEVMPHAVDDAHRDGYQLGQELGSDSGGVKRHRAFYIVDRSIPVAFDPGTNHNVDRAIVLRRFIE